MPDRQIYDVIIVGGGPAGMSAALVLARCCRKILLFDDGCQRNLKSDAMHGYLSRDGIPPQEFLAISRRELSSYGVSVIPKQIRRAYKEGDLFHTEDADGHVYLSKKLLLATGLSDRLPKLEGFDALYGKSIHHCPYCDGWENRNKRIAVYGPGKGAVHVSLILKTWSDDIILCTDGSRTARRQDLQKAERQGIILYTQKITRLEGAGGQLQRIHFADGQCVDRDSMFFSTGYDPHCTLAHDLGRNFSQKKKEVVVNRKQESSISGVYVCGDAAYDMKLVIIAAAEGAKAAVAINHALTLERFPEIAE